MNMKMYWPQHKVYFLATLSLFPESLNSTVITLLFFKPYFAADDVNVIELTLMEYAKDGYIEFEKLSNGEFKITGTNSLKATDDLTDYLEDWQNDQLSVLGAIKPASSQELHKLLLSALAKAYNPAKAQIRVLHQDIFGTDKSSIFGSPFWETVLALQFIEMKGKVTSVGYDRPMSGIYEENAQPFADIEITDPKFSRSLELAAKQSEPINDEDPVEMSYKGLLLGRDGLVSYKGKTLDLSTQERDILQVFLKRPEELRTKDDFKDPHTGVFKSDHNYPDIDGTLRKQISATHKKLRAALNQACIVNTPRVGWRLEIKD
jgi:hypothetical protein